MSLLKCIHCSSQVSVFAIPIEAGGMAICAKCIEEYNPGYMIVPRNKEYRLISEEEANKVFLENHIVDRVEDDCFAQEDEELFEAIRKTVNRYTEKR